MTVRISDSAHRWDRQKGLKSPIPALTDIVAWLDM